jgi:hypothetical protein
MIHPASEWGRTIQSRPPRPGVVTHLTVHWVGTKSFGRSRDQIPAGIKQIEQGQFARMPDLSAIGYNFLIDKWGRIWEGRGWQYRNAANGANTNNLTSMSVCVLVGISDANPNADMIRGLQSLWRLTSQHFGRPLVVQCHKDVRNTACPGPELTDLVRSGTITSGGNVSRIAGANRYETSVAVSKVAFPNGASVVYVASGTAFPDALSAASLAANGPVLLTDPNRLPPEVAGEIRRLKPLKVVIVGGTAAVSVGVENELAKLV